MLARQGTWSSEKDSCKRQYLMKKRSRWASGGSKHGAGGTLGEKWAGGARGGAEGASCYAQAWEKGGDQQPGGLHPPPCLPTLTRNVPAAAAVTAAWRPPTGCGSGGGGDGEVVLAAVAGGVLRNASWARAASGWEAGGQPVACARARGKRPLPSAADGNTAAAALLRSQAAPAPRGRPLETRPPPFSPARARERLRRAALPRRRWAGGRAVGARGRWPTPGEATGEGRVGDRSDASKRPERLPLVTAIRSGGASRRRPLRRPATEGGPAGTGSGHGIRTPHLRSIERVLSWKGHRAQSGGVRLSVPARAARADAGGTAGGGGGAWWGAAAHR